MPFDMQRMSIIQAIHNHTKSSYTQIKQISTITAVPLTVRDINRGGASINDHHPHGCGC